MFTPAAHLTLVNMRIGFYCGSGLRSRIRTVQAKGCLQNLDDSFMRGVGDATLVPDSAALLPAGGFIRGAQMSHQQNSGCVAICKKRMLPLKASQEIYNPRHGDVALDPQAKAVKPSNCVLLIEELAAPCCSALAGTAQPNTQGAAVIKSIGFTDPSELLRPAKLRAKAKAKAKATGLQLFAMVDFAAR